MITDPMRDLVDIFKGNLEILEKSILQSLRDTTRSHDNTRVLQGVLKGIEDSREAFLDALRKSQMRTIDDDFDDYVEESQKNATS